MQHTTLTGATARPPLILRALTWFNARIAKLCMILAVIGLVGIVAVVSWQVFGRYVLNNTPTWAESLALVLVIYVTMFGAAVGVRDAGHISLESMLVYILPTRFHVGIEIVIHLLVGTFGVMMAWHAAQLGLSVMYYKIPTLGLPEGVNHIPAVISGVMITLFSLEHILAAIAGVEVKPSWH